MKAEEVKKDAPVVEAKEEVKEEKKEVKKATKETKKETKKAAKAPAKKPAKKKTAKKTVPALLIQSQYGAVISPEDVLSRIPADADTVYVKPEDNKAYWVKGEECGEVYLWE